MQLVQSRIHQSGPHGRGLGSRMTRAGLSLLLAGLAFCFTGGCASSSPPPVYKPVQGGSEGGHKIYFSMRDPKGDDNGPGFYQYPLSFNNREGFLDIEKFQVEDGGSNVIFRITTRRPIDKFRTDGSSEAKGWYLQLMDIYIDKDHKAGSGTTRSLPGRFVEFSEESAWEQMVLVTPNRTEDVKRLIEGRTNDLDLVHLKSKIAVADQVFIEGFDFVVRIPKGTIGTPEPGWGYQVLMMMFDGKNLANYQFQNARVYKFPTDDSFGGGTDFLGNTAVIDLLATSDKQQHDWLSAFSATSNPDDAIPATISCVYPDLPPASRPAARRGVKGKRARPVVQTPATESTRQAPAGATRATSPEKRTVTPTRSTGRYKKVSFSGDPDDLFRNVPRSR